MVGHLVVSADYSPHPASVTTAHTLHAENKLTQTTQMHTVKPASKALMLYRYGNHRHNTL